MKSARRIAALALLAAIVYVFQTGAQETQRTARPSDQDEQQTGGTMRPVIRGAHAAVSSMKPEATRAAENILRAGGNAFDAAVAGQAVLALVDPASNGIGSDAEILIYDAKTKQPYSINAEAPAPKLATIEWYNKNNGGKIPTNDGLLSGSIPGTVDAWYILLDRWGTMSFEKVLEQANDTAKVETPVSTDYRGYRVYKNMSNTQGPAELILLNMLEGYDLRAMGHNSAEYIHTTAEALKLAFADREKFLGDMDFIKIPFEGLLSKQYAAERRKLIDPNNASLELRPGNPEKFMKGSQAALFQDPTINLDGNASHDGDTSYLAVIDSNRNMIGFMPSLHSGWGTGVVMADLGFIFNCRGDYYSLVPGEANALAPGKRPRSTLATTLIMKDGQPYGLMGSPGADDQLMRTVQTLLNMVDFGMNVQQAIEAPRWSTRSFPASPFPHTMYA